MSNSMHCIGVFISLFQIPTCLYEPLTPDRELYIHKRELLVGTCYSGRGIYLPTYFSLFIRDRLALFADRRPQMKSPMTSQTTNL